ncbi:hypothetical protein [Alkalibacterium sp. MB6]|uniref:hypothetical protein n=1 Tax=Alkalibacterium sp. MB6 TaxID=2081965 RepID=UPI00137B77DB|nr:hypothetical protein [Alkalibacterium sp. MB6]
MKKSAITIPLLLVATLSTIVFGRRYAAERQEGMDDNQLVSGSELQEYSQLSKDTSENPTGSDGDMETNEELLEDYEGREDTLSIYERLDYLSLLKNQVTLAFYGDIDLEEDWAVTLTDRLTTQTSNDLVVLDHTFPNYDTYQLYIEQTVEGLTSDNPDIIIYGLPALPDKVRDIGLSETEEFMTTLLTSLTVAEETELYLLEPYPIINEINQLNSRSLDYRSYLNRMRDVAEERDIPILPLHSGFIESSNAEDLAPFYEEGTNELNDAGTERVNTVLEELFSEPR